MSEIVDLADNSHRSGTSAQMIRLNSVSSLMKKNEMNTTEKIPMTMLAATEATEPMTDETLEKLSSSRILSRITVTIS